MGGIDRFDSRAVCMQAIGVSVIYVTSLSRVAECIRARESRSDPFGAGRESLTSGQRREWWQGSGGADNVNANGLTD
jgi:hypothetical protein